MTPALNGDDIKLLKGIFATKNDLKGLATKNDLKGLATKDDLKGLATKDDLKKTETKLIKRMDDMDKFLDREHMKLVKEVDKIKIHVGLPIAN